MSTSASHIYGSKCRLAPIDHGGKADGRPPLHAQFFYSSLIPIDDPLSTGSTTTGSDNRSSKRALRPFGVGDNNALEKAWLSLASQDDCRVHNRARMQWNRNITPVHQRGGQEGPRGAARADDDDRQEAAQRHELLVKALALKHLDKHGFGYEPQDVAMPVDAPVSGPSETVCCSQLLFEVHKELQRTFCALVAKIEPSLAPDSVVQDISNELHRLRSIGSRAEEARAIHYQPELVGTGRVRASSLAELKSPETSGTWPGSTLIRKGELNGFQVFTSAAGRRSSTSSATRATSRTQTPVGSPTTSRPIGADHGISGKPFLRVGSPDIGKSTAHQQEPKAANAGVRPFHTETLDGAEAHDTLLHSTKTPRTNGVSAGTLKYAKDSMDVAVGVSRLHMVTLPTLQMKPIYWSPVNDLAVVARATWFYRDTMLPVPSLVANQLESGYHELQPWSETWQDEVKCAIDVGPLGEEKVSHQLWPKDPDSSDGSCLEPLISSEPSCSARCCQGEAAAEGTIEPIQLTNQDTSEPPNRPFFNYHVLYKNDHEAFMLKPSLKPSAYYGRRPLLKISRGVTVGIPVVRGFDRHVWERMHHRRQTPNIPGASAASQSHESRGQGVCPACKADKDRGQVFDLVLVAHGIGQKFAERVESFHFTHAINAFRRAVNIELGTPVVQQILRKDQNGMMILPLNWRLGLSFEDGGPMQDEDKNEYTPEGFGLKDIEPDTIPAVRSMISDVMFDIPFYMSHHKGKMIQAMVAEANRVYRLWCRNNPGFAEKGRVHIIGHSLGSAMALDVLSRQPTNVPRLDLSKQELETGFFEFDTKNLFLVGSPAGFFLLLERGTLVPRRGRLKPGADPSDSVAGNVVGDAGHFGCLAVDNIYNILAKEDPIAYLLNGAVDSTYAASLKRAYVPSTAISVFKSIGDAMRSVVPGVGPAVPDHLALEPDRPSTLRLPSQLELEVHDFTREDIAEKKAHLLNDNGQIDWFLRSTGGPLEIQYLNMLSAHTSYWNNHDFIRMLCIEVGRKPGRKHTLPAMRAIKRTKIVVPRAK